MLRRHILDSGRVEFRGGVGVQGLVASQASGAAPTVTGVRLANGDTLAADLVLDATGRRSKIANWLEAVGVPRLREFSEPCGITYSSRFYRVRPGAEPPLFEGGLGADLGYIKYGIFPGDSGVFSITLSTSPDDAPMRRVLRPDGFEAAALAIPAVAAWVDPEVSEPVTPVHSFANLKNTRRFQVEDGEPIALGILSVGDAGAHANPITGRGCSFAWITAYLVAEALRKHPDDLRSLALDVHDGIEREIAPWFKLQVDSDRDAIAVAEAVRAGLDPYATTRPDGEADARGARRALMRDGLRPAMRKHLFVMRAFMRAMNLLDPPADLLKRPELMKAVLEAYQERETREGAHPGSEAAADGRPARRLTAGGPPELPGAGLGARRQALENHHGLRRRCGLALGDNRLVGARVVPGLRAVCVLELDDHVQVRRRTALHWTAGICCHHASTEGLECLEDLPLVLAHGVPVVHVDVGNEVAGHCLSPSPWRSARLAGELCHLAP